MLGLKVVVQAHGTSGIKVANLADDEAIALTKERGTWFDMDIYDDDYILAKGEKIDVSYLR
jgi:hypothetical protein